MTPTSSLGGEASVHVTKFFLRLPWVYIGKQLCRTGIKKLTPKDFLLLQGFFFPVMNNVREQNRDLKHVYITSVVEQYFFHLLSEPTVIPREPKLAKPQRA